ncbi:response regulator [Breoghania sp.]|uniref:response regulator n=1 Tax=Breoghania sp. TaxID=2065378 RepID=UPI0029CA1310|nr:response regulator [Breoghania sp.]
MNEPFGMMSGEVAKKKIMRHSAAYKLPLSALDIVVVDDSKQMQTIIRSVLLAMRVARVRTFDTAEKALQAMLTEPPNLIITDWRMEPVTGYQLLRSIRHRQMAPLCFVPVLMITAHTTRPLVEKALKAGAHHVLAKPLAPNALHQRIEWIARDERKFCLDPGQDFFVIDGVSAALAVQSERRQALDNARLNHARSLGGESKSHPARTGASNKSPQKPADEPLVLEERKSSRGMGDLVKPASGAFRAAAAIRAEADAVTKGAGEKSKVTQVKGGDGKPSGAKPKGKPGAVRRSPSR